CTATSTARWPRRCASRAWCRAHRPSPPHRSWSATSTSRLPSSPWPRAATCTAPLRRPPHRRDPATLRRRTRGPPSAGHRVDRFRSIAAQLEAPPNRSSQGASVRARTLLLLTGLSPWLGAVPAAAQPGAAGKPPDKPADKPPDKSPDKPADKPGKPVTLDARVKALEVDLEDARDANADLKSEVADLKAQIAASKPPASLNALNPQITAFLNGAMRVDDRQVTTPGGVAIDDRPFLRTAEIDFRAAVDPYADAVAIVALEDEAGEGFSADIEEGYAILKRLPVLESAPLGL